MNAGSTLATHGIDFIDEDNAGSGFLGLLKEVAHAARSHTNHHFDELRTTDGEKEHARFPGNGASQQRLARARRSHQQQAAGNLATQALELLRRLQELDDLEARIAELEQLLATAQIIDRDQVPTDAVSLGSVAHLATSDGRTYRYTIVGSYEADPGAGRISHESPVGKALLGRKTGDQVMVATPGGVKVYTILSIE
jgi:transcription elongation GreA/GreB family factor